MKLWASDLPFEVIGGDSSARKAQWLASRCPVKVVNYELLTRDEEFFEDPEAFFDVVVLDEAQRIKNREGKTARVVRSIARDRSWAMTGTPIENRVEDLINLFAFIDPERVPPDTPAKLVRELTQDMILRRVKEEVMTDMPPKVIQDVYLDLSPAQRASYDMAEQEGVIHLNELGDTVTVQHVFELVLRLKQICNFDPRTGDSAKLDQLLADMDEVAESNRQALVFSQWVEPLETLAQALEPYGPMQYHARCRSANGSRSSIASRRTRATCAFDELALAASPSMQFVNYVSLRSLVEPAIEDQAIGRGASHWAKGDVFVKRFVWSGTHD